MGDEKAGHDKPSDPMDPWREMRDTYLKSWSKTMIETVNSDGYVKATGAMLDTYLSASSPFRETIEKAMLHALQQLSMPSRADFVGLAERVTNIEMRLDDMDAKLDLIKELISKSEPAEQKKTKKRAE
jgi:hypothetical protein